MFHGSTKSSSKDANHHSISFNNRCDGFDAETLDNLVSRSSFEGSSKVIRPTEKQSLMPNRQALFQTTSNRNRSRSEAQSRKLSSQVRSSHRDVGLRL